MLVPSFNESSFSFEANTKLGFVTSVEVYRAEENLEPAQIPVVFPLAFPSLMVNRQGFASQRGREWTMKREIDANHPLRKFFSEALVESMHERLGLTENEDVLAYIENLLVTFLHDDRIYSVKDAFGHRVESVAEMMLEGDVRYHADSFDREREVHKHIGDFVLFWSGLFPEFLTQLKSPFSRDFLVDYTKQGKLSYHVVSTFEFPPYNEEAGTFKKLSDAFEEYQYGLSLVRASFEGFALQGWVRGFEA